jgi:hypothetical protein
MFVAPDATGLMTHKYERTTLSDSEVEANAGRRQSPGKGHSTFGIMNGGYL